MIIKKSVLKRFFIIVTVAFLLVSVLPLQTRTHASYYDPASAKKTYTIYTKSDPEPISFKNLAADAEITYKSEDKAVVIVKNGKLVPKGEGTTTVIATIKQSGFTYTSRFEVVVSPSSLKFSTEPKTDMVVGNTQKLKVKGIGVTINKIKWTSSNKSVATVTSAGKIKAKKAGTVKITGTETKSKLKISLTITVFDKETTIKIPSRENFIASLDNITVDNTSKRIDESSLCTDAKEAETYILQKIRLFSGFNLVVKDLNILMSAEEFLSKYPSISSFRYDSVIKYSNAYVVKVKADKECSFYSDEYIIDVVLSNGNTSLLDQNEYTTYSSILASANNLKGSGEYETVKNIHDALVANYVYKDYGDKSHMLSYALSKRECVCDGYSKSFYFLCRAAGINVIMVHGNATSASGTEAHSWNKVKINGKWYSIDVTWDDPLPDKPGEVQINYFLLTDADMARNHTWDNKGLPSAVSSDLGTIYKQIDGITQTSGYKEFVSTAAKMLESAAAEITAAGSKTITMQLIANSDTEACWTELKNMLSEYNKSKGFGYKSRGEGVGIFGSLYEFTLYK